MKKNILLILLCFLLISTLAVGCGGSDVKTPDAPGNGEVEVKDSIKMALSGDISTMDPYDMAVLITRTVRANWYESLVYYNGESFDSLLAESHDISSDGLEYTFDLKKGVKFHNGEELTADDVVFSLKTAQASPGFQAETATIETIEALDEYTVKVTLTEQYAPFLLSVISRVCITNKEYTEAGGEESYNSPVGTGPYRLIERIDGAKIILESFDSWHGGEVPIKHAEYVIIADPSSAVMSLESKDIDLTYTLPSIAVSNLEKDDDITVSEVVTQGSGYLVYNITDSPFDDINFRKACSYLVDRETIVESALDGIGAESVKMWGPATVGYSENNPFPEYDLTKAKEYLEKSNYDGEPINFVIGNETYKRTALLLQEEFSKIGVKINVEVLEFNTWINDMKNGDFQISYVIRTVPEDADMWNQVFTTTGIGVANFSRISREDIDEIFARARTITDVKERTEYYDQISKIVVDEALMIPVIYRVMTPAYNKDLNIKRFETTGYADIVNISWN